LIAPSSPAAGGLAVDGFFALGAARWPTLHLDEETFERHLRILAEQLGPPQLRHADDLYLACACARGVDGALAGFEAKFAGTLASAIARVDGSSAFVEEAAQALRIKLFVRAPPKIAAYGGRAKLSTWLTTLAVRSAIDQCAVREHATLRSSIVDHLEGGDDPELDYVRGRYKTELEAAVATALGRLSPRDRGLLRLHLAEHMSIDRLALAYGVGRSTAARWLAAARAKLLDDTRHEVHARLGITPSEIRDLGYALGSQLHVSLVRLLGPSHE